MMAQPIRPAPVAPHATEIFQSSPRWLPVPGHISHHCFSGTLPPRDLTTCVFALGFIGERIVLARHERRGWDIPGGHLEPNEDFENGLLREVWEETKGRLALWSPALVARMELRGPKPEGYTYPFPISYMLFYLGQFKDVATAPLELETKEARAFSRAEALDVLAGRDAAKIVDWAFSQRNLVLDPVEDGICVVAGS